MANFTVKRKEAKTLSFTIKDKITKEVLDVASDTLSFQAKPEDDLDGTPTIDKNDAAFDKTTGTNPKLALSDTDLDISPGLYAVELMITFSSSNIDKSKTLYMEVEEAVHN